MATGTVRCPGAIRRGDPAHRRRGQRALAHLFQLGTRGHLLGEQRGLDAVEQPFQPADQLGLGDSQLGIGGHRVLGERQGQPLEFLAQLGRQAVLQLADRGAVDVAEAVAAGVVQRRGLDLLQQLFDHGADPHHLRGLFDQVGDGFVVVVRAAGHQLGSWAPMISMLSSSVLTFGVLLRAFVEAVLASAVLVVNLRVHASDSTSDTRPSGMGRCCATTGTPGGLGVVSQTPRGYLPSGPGLSGASRVRGPGGTFDPRRADGCRTQPPANVLPLSCLRGRPGAAAVAQAIPSRPTREFPDPGRHFRGLRQLVGGRWS